MKIFNQIVWMISGVLLLGGCNLINPEEEVPAYLHIMPFEVETKAGEGSNSSLITEAWVFIDGDYLGAYSLPITIPIIEKGQRTVRLKAGIRDSGVATYPEIYPFYEAYEVEMDLKAEQVDTIRPIVKYVDGISFALIEDFDGAFTQFSTIRIGSADNALTAQQIEVFEGNGSGKAVIDTSNSVVEINTDTKYTGFTSNGIKTYLEVDYKSDVPVAWGLIGYTDNSSFGDGELFYAAGFNPTSEWKKIYINLSDIPNNNREYSYFSLVFQGYIPVEDGNLTLDEAEIYLDNVKLIHY